ncbi:MAG: hypothetical protein ACFFD8_10965 [Candidatus Thorarchaeota archaeon]
MKLDLSTVGISCVACGTRTTLEQAIQKGWHQCLRCQFFIDPHCLHIVESTMSNICPSFSQGVSRHTIQTADIPSDQILIFVKDQYQKGRIGGLIESLFYTKHSTLGLSRHENLPPETAEEPLTREEIWKRYGLVLVQRDHGKWKAWEKVGTT